MWWRGSPDWIRRRQTVVEERRGIGLGECGSCPRTPVRSNASELHACVQSGRNAPRRRGSEATASFGRSASSHAIHDHAGGGKALVDGEARESASIGLAGRDRVPTSGLQRWTRGFAKGLRHRRRQETDRTSVAEVAQAMCTDSMPTRRRETCGPAPPGPRSSGLAAGLRPSRKIGRGGPATMAPIENFTGRVDSSAGPGQVMLKKAARARRQAPWDGDQTRPCHRLSRAGWTRAVVDLCWKGRLPMKTAPWFWHASHGVSYEGCRIFPSFWGSPLSFYLLDETTCV